MGGCTGRWEGQGGGDGQWGGPDWEGQKGWQGPGVRRGLRMGIRGGGGGGVDWEGEIGKGATGRGDGEGLTGRGRWERGQRGGGNEGTRAEGISQRDMMKCLGGRRLQTFLTLFTRATPGSPASII